MQPVLAQLGPVVLPTAARPNSDDQSCAELELTYKETFHGKTQELGAAQAGSRPPADIVGSRKAARGGDHSRSGIAGRSAAFRTAATRAQERAVGNGSACPGDRSGAGTRDRRDRGDRNRDADRQRSHAKRATRADYDGSAGEAEERRERGAD